MSQKSIILVVALFIFIVAGMLIYAGIKKDELGQTSQPNVSTEEELSAENLYPGFVTVTAKHYYNERLHTLVGEIDMPTPCDLLQVDAVVLESYPEQVILDFSVINNSGGCIQVITQQRFKVEVEASKLATFSARFMSRDMELNLVPAGEGELPEDFELFIKG